MIRHFMQAGLACLLTVFSASIALADHTERLGSVEVDASFMTYHAYLDVSIGNDGSLKSLTVSGDIPDMQTTTQSIQDFVKSGGYAISGKQGPAFGLKFDGAFTAQQGGNLFVYALMCDGGDNQQVVDVEQVSAGNWAIVGGGRALQTIKLNAGVDFSGWTGCFNSIDFE